MKMFERSPATPWLLWTSNRPLGYRSRACGPGFAPCSLTETYARENKPTPALIKEFPRPLRRFIGNLANILGLFVELDLITQDKIPV